MEGIPHTKEKKNKSKSIEKGMNYEEGMRVKKTNTKYYKLSEKTGSNKTSQ